MGNSGRALGDRQPPIPRMEPLPGDRPRPGCLSMRGQIRFRNVMYTIVTRARKTGPGINAF